MIYNLKCYTNYGKVVKTNFFENTDVVVNNNNDNNTSIQITKL